MYGEQQQMRQVQMSPTRFYFHRDLKGEVALTDDDEPILCRACSIQVVRSKQMERLREVGEGEADANGPQCRLCGRFSWGGYVSATRERRAAYELPTVGGLGREAMIDHLRDLLDEEDTRLKDLGSPPLDEGDAARTRERIATLLTCRLLLVAYPTPVSEALLALARKLHGIVEEAASGYGDPMDADGPFRDVLLEARAMLGQ